MRSIFLKTLEYWLPLAVAVSVLFIVVYAESQQVIRRAANDPQIQIARDTADVLSSGIPANEVIPPGPPTDPSTSLDPFVIVFNNSGMILASDATLRGVTPSVPSGVFDYVRKEKEDRFTWQPASGVRIATVVTSFASASSTGFVLAGRSLTEVERNENGIFDIAIAGWIASLLLSLFVFLIIQHVVSLKRK